MSAQKKRVGFWLPFFTVLLVGLVYAFWPKPVAVELGVIEKGSMKVSVTDEADTRIHDIYTLSSPISGFLRRIDYDVGDQVVAGETVIAAIEPSDSEFLDPRTRAQTLASRQAAVSAKHLANEEVAQALADYQFAESEQRRIATLAKNGTVSQRESDDAERNYKSAKARLATARAALQIREFEVQRLDAILATPEQQKQAGQCQECMMVKAPITGTILKVLQASEGVVRAGTPLIEIGNAKDLEVVVELLSVDAVKVQPGMSVEFHNWGGNEPLNGRVSIVEPFGFTKFSALGIEEQRVNVIVEFVSDYPKWQRLGHGYQMDASIIIWQQDNVLQIPLTALFRERENWAVYVVTDGIVEKRLIDIGQRNQSVAQVLAGLKEGDTFIAYPSNQIQPNMKVVALDKLH